MKLKINKKYINITPVEGLFNRFKCMKFKLETITEGYLFEKHNFINTYFFCQRVDIIMTDKENKIIRMYQNLNTEKFKFWKRKVYNTFILPLGSCKNYNIGDKLKIKQ